MIQIFVPPTEFGEKQGVERRKYPRYQFMPHIEICLDDGSTYLTVYSATTFEISEGGLSAATPNYLNIGVTAELSPVLGDTVKAIVRRKLGAMYGFEFIGITEQQKAKIRELCKGLPPFQSSAQI